MTGFSRPRASALGVVCAVLLSGCSSGVLGSGSTVTVVIGVDGPLTGKLADLGLGIRNSAELAIAKANAKNVVPGVKFVLDAKDDEADEQKAKSNGDAFAADGRVMGVVGPLTSSGAILMAPVMAQAGLAEVSPSNTAPGLTWGADYRANGKKRQYPTYFRTVTTDAVQGPLLARYAHSRLKAGRAAVISDTKAYGSNLAAEFATAFEEVGGKVVYRTTVKPGTTDFSKIAQLVAAQDPDIVYYGGEHPEGGPLGAALKAAGVKVPLAAATACTPTASSRPPARPPTGTSPASRASPSRASPRPSATSTPTARLSYKEEPGPFGAYGYDSTWAVIQAVAKARQSNEDLTGPELRKATADALQNVSFFGVTGDVSFDEFGDTHNQVASIYKVQKGAWTSIVPFGRLRDF
ncbi:branched-chain amino acid ABC transporter substrate-binding protein [Kitasatospora arboriphila]